ncbi:MAG: glycosyltransferase family 39 protein, partial [bacterium]|nr:glycosyltransferase family 39 protein [bacterium]
MKIFLRKPKLLLCVLGCFLALLLMAKIRLIGYVIGSDGLGYYAHLRSAFIDKDLHYANEFLEYNPFNHHVQNPHRRSATDHVPNKYYIGPALLWTPFFLVAHSLTLVVGKFGFILEPDGYSVFYQFFIGLGSVIYGLIGLVLIYKIVLRFFSQKEALLATGLITFSTNVFDYLANEPSMSHALSLFGVSLFVYLWLKDIGSRQHKTMIWLGLTAGLMVLCRPQNLLFTVLLLVEWLGGLKSESSLPSPPFSKRLVEGGFFGGAFLFMLVPQFIVWKILYGQFLYFAYRGKGFDFLNPHLVESLFSARHGLISWTPVIFLALTGVLFF